MVTEPIAVTPGGTAPFSVSDIGVLVYRTESQPSRLTWFDRSGKELGTSGDARNYWDVELSPDDRYVSVSDEVDSPLNRDILAIDLKRNVPEELKPRKIELGAH